jgi:hypothetical protein
VPVDAHTAPAPAATAVPGRRSSTEAVIRRPPPPAWPRVWSAAPCCPSSLQTAGGGRRFATRRVAARTETVKL